MFENFGSISHSKGNALFFWSSLAENSLDSVIDEGGISECVLDERQSTYRVKLTENVDFFLSRCKVEAGHYVVKVDLLRTIQYECCCWRLAMWQLF